MLKLTTTQPRGQRKWSQSPRNALLFPQSIFGRQLGRFVKQETEGVALGSCPQYVLSGFSGTLLMNRADIQFANRASRCGNPKTMLNITIGRTAKEKCCSSITLAWSVHHYSHNLNSIQNCHQRSVPRQFLDLDSSSKLYSTCLNAAGRMFVA